MRGVPAAALGHSLMQGIEKVLLVAREVRQCAVYMLQVKSIAFEIFIPMLKTVLLGPRIQYALEYQHPKDLVKLILALDRLLTA